jgi:hypothetical protein
MRSAFQAAAMSWTLVAMGMPLAPRAAQSQPSHGDGIFTPTIEPLASIDKTGRPITVEVIGSEPAISKTMNAGTSTGDSYIIHFPTGDAGGACTYTGAGRYLIQIGGVLTFQILADCGKLKRSYSYMICMLDPDLRCTQTPWWFFRDRTYAVTSQGVVVGGATVYPWRDASQAPRQLQSISEKIQSMRDRFAGVTSSQVVHARLISCRAYHPATHSYDIHEFSTTGVTNMDAMRDGDPIAWGSPAGEFVKQQGKVSDVSMWDCWVRTQ